MDGALFDFDAFFLQHYSRLYHLLYQMVGTQLEAEDLAQEAFLRFHQHFSSIFPDKRKAWLFRVAVNLGYTALQSRRRHQRWSQRESLHLDHQKQLPLDESELSVRNALDSLPERQAKLLLLYSAGLSYEEMAEALHVKVSSVSQLLLRAKQAFKVTYEQQ